MSRIDEALKRAAQNPSTGPVLRPASERPIGVVHDLTLEQYPGEARSPVEPTRFQPGPPPPPSVPDLPLRSDEHERRPSFARARVSPNDKLVSGDARRSPSLEQYRRLAAALHSAQDEHGIKKVLVTSAMPQEGKTLTVVNLALTLTESYGRRVLLIDGDLRRPSIHEVLGIPNENGLTNVLHGDRRDPPIVQVSPRLAVLTAGPLDANPQAGLSSVHMRTLLDEAAAQFDWVLLDSPPMALVSDAQLLSRLTQAVVLVIAADSTPFHTVERAIEEIGREHIIGTVLNRATEPAGTRKYYDYRSS